MQTENVTRVLIVDDDADICMFVACVLGASSDVEVFHSVEAAVRRLDLAPPFDLVLCDYRLPGSNGLALIEQIRAHVDPVTAAVPIVMMSGNADPELDVQARAAGADRFLDKPFTLMQLRWTVGSVLAAGRMRAEVAAVA